MTVYSQDFRSDKWKNRLLLILTSDVNLDIFKAQIQELENDTVGLQERKLLIYKILPENKKSLSDKESNRIYDKELYESYNEKNSEFKVILIGLDGFIKLEQTTLLKITKLFSLIDGMPMRKAEIRNNK